MSGRDLLPGHNAANSALVRCAWGMRVPAWAPGALMGALVLAGCTVGPDFVRPVANTPMHWSTPVAGARPDGTQRDSAIVEAEADLRQWWSRFKDPTLSALVERALAANLDIRAAGLRIDEARAQRALAASSFAPTVSANASYSRIELSGNTPTGALFGSLGKFGAPGAAAISVPNPYGQYQLGAQLSWEIDLFGRARRSVELADANLAGTLEDQHAARIALLGEVAQSYIALRGAQLRKSTVERNIATTNELLALALQRRAAGLSSEIDVTRSRAQQASTVAQLPALELSITVAINALSRLVNEPPGSLRSQLERTEPVPPLPPEVPIGLPAELARRRPDIRRAEANLHAATAAIGVAVAGVYPHLELGAVGGFQSQSAGTLVQWASRFGSLGPTLELPIFDRGRWTGIRLQEVRAQEAALAYSATVLIALHEVEDARAAYDADQDRRAWFDAGVRNSRDAWQMLRQRYEGGVASYIEVLDAERTLQQNQLALDDAAIAASGDLVRLYRALGGGWEEGIQVGEQANVLQAPLEESRP